MIGFAAVSLFVPHIVAPRKKTVVKDMPYESGMDPIDDARKPLDVQFYLLAILFLVFDVELLLVLPYAVALRAENGLPVAFPTSCTGSDGASARHFGASLRLAWRSGVFQWRLRQREKM